MGPGLPSAVCKGLVLKTTPLSWGATPHTDWHGEVRVSLVVKLAIKTTPLSWGATPHTDRHGEVRVSLVVVEHIADHLVEHGEEGVECPQASEVHDVVQLLGILQCLHHQTI